MRHHTDYTFYWKLDGDAFAASAHALGKTAGEALDIARPYIKGDFAICCGEISEDDIVNAVSDSLTRTNGSDFTIKVLETIWIKK